LEREKTPSKAKEYSIQAERVRPASLLERRVFEALKKAGHTEDERMGKVSFHLARSEDRMKENGTAPRKEGGNKKKGGTICGGHWSQLNTGRSNYAEPNQPPESWTEAVPIAGGKNVTLDVASMPAKKTGNDIKLCGTLS